MIAPRSVHCQRHFSHSADHVWQQVHDFYSDWHPFIARCEQESPKPIRRFTMPGSTQVYREQLTYYSATQRCFRYEMLAGIAGVKRYQAGVTVAPTDEGCLLSWWANIAGDEQLVHKVAQGTAEVFEAGFDAIETSLRTPSPQPIAHGRFIGNGAFKRRGAKDSGTTAPPLPMRERGLGGEGVKCGTLTLTHHPSPNNPDYLCLFLHGIGGNRSNWDDQLPAIAEIMPCAALDLRGYGDSALGDQPTTVDDYCADIRAVAKHFGAQKLILAGLSYGSWIATHFALHYPNELAGLVLCGGCTGMSEAPEAVRQGFLQARLEPMNAGQTPADFADNVVQMISGPQASDVHKAAMRDSMAAIPAETYRDALHCFTHPPGRFDFGQLACPALLLTGEHDQLAPPEEIAGVALRMVEAERPEDAPLPDVRFEVLVGAGHMANLEQANGYNQLLGEFLRRLSAS